ncbi:hypothetical protein [Algisphaera agarilytica]|uniref:Glycosyl transferase family 2 n=1 Tax=Algisphaera agarilytica TaxID=1385975 RepID=A0A7X0LL11_9BACT|nr:hypothetical protein [Algisphaera agarilytica]MBB6430394.1 hypothetical protein [Algisphaera agarilytica]
MMYRPHDNDITFYLQVYRDVREAKWCLANLRRVYPNAKVLMVSDGDDNPVWPKIAQRHNARYVAGARLYATEYGGRMIQRMLDLYAENPTPYLVKIDTDTWVHRRLRYLPTGCKVFGTLEWVTWAGQEPLGYPNVQGGFVGYTREAITLMRSSKLLVSTRLQDYDNTYADVADIRRRAERGMVSFDFLTRYACKALGITCEEYDEVKSQYRGWVPETDGQFAFTHPHKEIASRSALSRLAREVIPTPVKAQIQQAVTTAQSLAGISKPVPKPRPAVKRRPRPSTARSDAA